jgi:DNA (cytosine-5)-methyltransferase 1
MKYLSVCSGIEAATVAWHGLGWQPVAFAEIDAFPAAVLGHHYPSVRNLGDMTKYREWPEELIVDVDLLVGGTPCQAFSVAGRRLSLDDERGNLSLVYVNLYHHINEIRKRHGRPPAIALWENVPGVLSTKDNAFGCFIGGLLGCDEAPATESGKWDKAGFLCSETVRVGYRVLDAQYFGVAQRRRRVFLVAMPCELVKSLGERACPSEILSLRESVLGNPPARNASWEGSARPTAASLTGSGRGVERCGESRGQDDVVVSCPPTARTLTQRMHKGFDSTLDSQTPIVAFTKSKRAQSENDDESWVPGEVAPTQNQFDVGDTRATTVVAFKESQSGTGLGDVHSTIDSNKGSRRQEGVRRLTPTECEFLQGFPAGYTDVVYRNKPAADGPRYRALGNSMAVPCMWWLGHRISVATG